eukprot:4030976-Karenia_brevis.AAC.1
MSPDDQFKAILSTRCPADWETIGQFLFQVRRNRRRFKEHCTTQCRILKKRSFGTQKVAWRARGLHVCRHGMFFRSGFTTCSCTAQEPDWSGISYMPVIDQHLKALMVQRFDSTSVQRLGQLQSTMRQRG